MKATLPLLSLPLLAALAGCADMAPVASAALAPATGARLQSCAELPQRFKFADTVLDDATDVAAGVLKLGGQEVAPHCRVVGRMSPRKGADGRDYAIGFEMRLPADWNGRFYYQGNGGLDGVVRPATGELGGGPVSGALQQGFAVISSDAGHTGAQTPYFGLEPQARLDYGYEAVGKLTPMAKALITSAYGKGPDRSYIGGCSNGGRHVMVAAARYGDQYDGYLAGAPGYRLPNAALAQLWGAQQWAPLATPGATAPHPLAPQARIPDLSSALTVQERQLVARALLERCDALDGLRDGMVQATLACQARFDVQRDIPTCTGERNGQCLGPEQKRVLASVYAGGTLRNGQAIYAPFLWDAGIAGSNWAAWKFVNAVALDPLSVGTVFSVPAGGPVDPFKVDLDARRPMFDATDERYRVSGLALMSPPGQENPANLNPLWARGARMIVFHGASDAIFSAEDSRRWVERVDRVRESRVAAPVRLFLVPGMNHCSGGPATDQFDLLTPLVNWVEQGIPPQAVMARARGAGNSGGVNTELPPDWAPERTRPLCAYPTVARYRGQGPTEEAGSFACQ